MLRYFNYTIYPQLPLNYKFARNFRSITSYDSRWHYSYIARKTKENVARLQVIILPDVQATIENTLVGQLQGGLFIGPVLTLAKQEAIDRKKTKIQPHLLEEHPADFIGPVNIDYLYQRIQIFEWCDLIIEEPHPITWAEASNTTRSLWENWWEACESLIKAIQQLPLNWEQVAVIRELDLKLNESFHFFEQRKALEDFKAQVKSRTRSGKRC